MDMRNESIFFSRPIAQSEENTKTKLAMQAKVGPGIASRVVAESSRSWRDEIIRLLKDSLISELVYLLYCNKSLQKNSTRSKSDSNFFFVTQQELAYANNLAKHIAQLEGEMACSPSALGQLSGVVHERKPDLQSMVEAHLTDEFVAILSYSRIIPLINKEDTETHRLLNEILNAEKEHAERMKARLIN